MDTISGCPETSFKFTRVPFGKALWPLTMKLLGGKQYSEGRLPGGKVWMSMTLSLSLQLLPKAAPVNKNVFLVNMPCLLKG